MNSRIVRRSVSIGRGTRIELLQRALVLRLVQLELAGPRNLHARDQPEALILDRGHELDALGRELLDRALDVVTHEEELVPAAGLRLGVLGIDQDVSGRNHSVGSRVSRAVSASSARTMISCCAPAAQPSKAPA